MKRSFLLLCCVLFVLGSALPLVSYRVACAVMDHTPSAQSAPSSSLRSESPEDASPDPQTDFAGDAEVFRIRDQSSGEVLEVSCKEYVLGAVAAEMPVSWPDEALKAQAVAAHSYALYCRDHTTDPDGAWLTADPARRQGFLTEPVLRSYWGVDYESSYTRLSALVDVVLGNVLCYDGSAAGTSYFAISNGSTEASENVWGAPLPYLVSVDSSTDRTAEGYEYSVVLSAAQVQKLLADGLGIHADLAVPEQWFRGLTPTHAGYISSLSVCGQTVSGTALRRALGLRSTCFTVSHQSGSFCFTTHGYGHGVGMSQWGAKALAEQGLSFDAILAHYYPGTQLCG